MITTADKSDYGHLEKATCSHLHAARDSFRGQVDTHVVGSQMAASYAWVIAIKLPLPVRSKSATNFT